MKMILRLIAFAVGLGIALPAFAQGPSTNLPPIVGGGGGAGGGGGGAGGSTPAPPSGSLQTNNNGVFGSLLIGPSFTTAGGVLDLGDGLVSGLKLTSGAAAFNIGVLGGDLSGLLPSALLAVGAASRNVGNLGGGLTGTLPNPALNSSAVFAAIGPPGGDLCGSSIAAPLVCGLQGFPISATPPTPGSALVWNGSIYTQTVLSPGVNQGTGDVLFGPGSGSQVTTIANGAVTNQKLANEAALTLKCNPNSSLGVVQDCSVSGGLAFSGGALQLNPALGTSQQQTISDGTNKFCMLITNGTVTSIVAGQCSAGTTVLTADDLSTILTADDTVTQLSAEGGSPATACGALKGAGNVACNSAIMGILH